MRIPLYDTIKRATIRKRLWLGAGAVAVFIGTLVVALIITPPDPNDRGKVGLDFIAFYTAGRFVREGKSADLYDIHKVQVFQHELARQNGVDLGSAVGPWWNPPFYAWTFVPLAELPYREAIKVWTIFNVGCSAVAVAVLCAFIAKFRDWRTWLLVPVLTMLSIPFIHALSHGQNTCTSLLIITIAVVLWRNERVMSAGLVTGLMFYKPQLAAVLSFVLVLSLGRRALIGLSLTGFVLLLASLALPGSIHNFLHQMPWNLHFVQCVVPYLWDRHVTFKAFWRLLIQGKSAGETWLSVTLLAGICQACVAMGLLWAIWRRAGVGPAISLRTLRGAGLLPGVRPVFSAHKDRPEGRCHESVSVSSRTLILGGAATVRDADPTQASDSTDGEGAGGTNHHDRLIAAAIAATPLLMPFYFDYDQLLLIIPAVLFAADFSRRDRSAPVPWADRWLLRIWPVQYAWLMLNSDIADLTHVNLGVPLLTAVAGLLIVRAGRPAISVATLTCPVTPISAMRLFADRDTDARTDAEQHPIPA